jgi:hypothetical protein
VDITERITDSHDIDEILEDAQFFQLTDLSNKLEQKRKNLVEFQYTGLEYSIMVVIVTII